MKALMIISLLVTGIARGASCPKSVPQEVDSVVILFDGLMTAELNLRLLERSIGESIKNRCGENKVLLINSYYGKSSARKVTKCLQTLQQKTKKKLKFMAIGHSFGAGKGVMNFIENFQKKKMNLDDVITFDPRGYSYKYTNPGLPTVKNFVNIYQRRPLAGKKVKNADYEIDVTGESSHIDLPKKLGDKALSQLSASFQCAI